MDNTNNFILIYECDVTFIYVISSALFFYTFDGVSHANMNDGSPVISRNIWSMYAR
jgi:hypothetical protein